MTDTNLLSRAPNQTWGTPNNIFEPINKLFHFDLDAAASPENAKCDLFLTEEDDSLSVDWYQYVKARKPHVDVPRVWTNPPYDFLFPWVEHAWHQSLKCITVNLLPPNVDNRWFIQLVAKGGIVDPERVDCWNYVGGLKNPSYGYKKKDNISRIKFVDPVGERVAPSKGNICVVYYPVGMRHLEMPANQWSLLF